jgi:hypothetical protein
MTTPSSELVAKNPGGWDKRAWNVSLIGSIPVAIYLTWALVTESGSSATDIGVPIGLSMIAFILPPVLVALCRRRWLFWAYLPMSLLLLALIGGVAVSVMLDYGAGSSGSGRADTGSLAMDPDMAWAVGGFFSMPLITALPVVCWRTWKKKRRKRIQELPEIDVDAGSEERVWPPRPKVI